MGAIEQRDALAMLRISGTMQGGVAYGLGLALSPRIQRPILVWRTMDIPGYTIFTGVTPFADHVGPIHQKQVTNAAGQDEHWVALRVNERHVNVWGFAHGALMTCMAEFSLNSPAYKHGGPPTVIMQMNMSFIAPPKKGDIFEACGTLIKGTRTMFFTDAKGYAGGALVFSATGIIKALKAQA